MSEYRIELTPGWSKDLNPEVLYEWLMALNNNVIYDEDSEFRIVTDGDSALIFKHREDAVAFRLRFGI